MIAHVFLLNFAPQALRAMLSARAKSNPLFAVAGFCVFGSMMGYASTAMFAQSLSPNAAFRTFNLALTPTLTGLLMRSLGQRLQQKGIETTYLESFRGGAAISFGLLITRFLILPSQH